MSHWAVRWIKEDCCVFVQTAMTSVLHLPDNAVNKPLSSQYPSLKFSPFFSCCSDQNEIFCPWKSAKESKKQIIFVKRDFWGLIVLFCCSLTCEHTQHALC